MAPWHSRPLPGVGPIPENGRSGAGEKSDDKGPWTALVPGPPKLDSNSKAILMASDSAGKPGRPLVVGSVEVSLNWLGAYQADYPCPRCKAPLTSRGETLMGTDSCPNCKTTVAFAPDVQTAYRLHKEEGERKGADKQRAAEQQNVAAQQRGQVSEADRQRLEEEEREFVERSKAEKRQIDKERAERVGKKRKSLRGIEDFVTILTSLSVAGCMFLVAVGFIAFSANNVVAGTTFLASGVTGLISALLVYGLFRCLFAIHQLLTDISAKLDEDRA